MITPYIQTQNEIKEQARLDYNVQLWRLLRSKRDVEHYTHALRTVYAMIENEEIKTTALNFLKKQLKVRDILNKLVERIQEYRKQQEAVISQQVEDEIEIFDEIHFRLKKSYYSFVSEYFSPTPPNLGDYFARA